MANQKNDLIIPACVIAGGIVLGMVLMRVLPANRGDVAPSLTAAIAANVNANKPSAPPRIGSGPLLGSLESSFVKEVHGDRVTIALSPGNPKNVPEIVLLLTPTTKYLHREGVIWTDHLLAKGDMIDFTPTDFDEHAKEVEAESVTLIFRPPPAK